MSEPLSDEALAAMRARNNRGVSLAESSDNLYAYEDRSKLIREVYRLRAENAALQQGVKALTETLAHERSLMQRQLNEAEAENAKLRADLARANTFADDCRDQLAPSLEWVARSRAIVEALAHAQTLAAGYDVLNIGGERARELIQQARALLAERRREASE